jgi:hypothetical protein
MGETFPNPKMLVGFFLPMGKKSYRIFSPVGFFIGQLIGVKTPPKSHGVLCILKTTTSTGVPFGRFRVGRKSNHLMERVYAHLSKNGCRKSGLLADSELTDTLIVSIIPQPSPRVEQEINTPYATSSFDELVVIERVFDLR